VVFIGALTLLERHPAQGEVVAFGAATCEHDLVWGTVQDLSYRLPRLVHGVVRLAPQAVDAGGVPVPIGPIGQHRLDDSWVHRRGRSMVHVDGLRRMLGHSLFLPLTVAKRGPAVARVPSYGLQAFPALKTPILRVDPSPKCRQPEPAQSSQEGLFWSCLGVGPQGARHARPGT
jgi:hypothetical protein